jgi:hypothetical protein
MNKIKSVPSTSITTDFRQLRFIIALNAMPITIKKSVQYGTRESKISVSRKYCDTFAVTGACSTFAGRL